MKYRLSETNSSYSKLDTFDQCPMRFYLQYVMEYYATSNSLNLDMGTLSHYGKEIWGEALIEEKVVDKKRIKNAILKGAELYDLSSNFKEEGAELCVDNAQIILGIDDLKKKYFEQYYERDEKSGMTYDEKIDLYLCNFSDTLEEPDWKVKAVELPFSFKYAHGDKNYKIRGYIDRVDERADANLRVVDYKSSREPYKDDKLKTPLQMFIYGLACIDKYGKLPIEYIYDFIFLGVQQEACSKGYYDRGVKKLNKLIDAIELCSEEEIFPPKPTPLCHWCNFCNTNPQADKETKGLCPYYSLWLPDCRIFAVNKKYEKEITVQETFVF